MRNSRFKIQSKKSYALNVAEAGGIYSGVSDAKIPKDSTGAMTDSMLYKGVDAGMGFINPGPGLSSLQGFGLGLLAGMLQPDSPGMRNSIMAWMPVDLAKDKKEAQQLMSRLIVNAAAHALESLNYPVSDYHKHITKREYLSVYVRDEYPGCAKNECRIFTYTPKAEIEDPPEFISSGTPVYSFKADHSQKYFEARTYFPKDFKISTLRIYEEMSKRLPDWVCIYLSPDKTFGDNGEKIKFPVLLQKGEPHLFVVRE